MQKLPKFLQPYLASYDLGKISIKKDKYLIITSILNKGDQEAMEWLMRTYSKRKIKEVIKNPCRGSWYKKTLSYWLKIFDIKLPHDTIQKAIIRF